MKESLKKIGLKPVLVKRITTVLSFEMLGDALLNASLTIAGYLYWVK